MVVEAPDFTVGTELRVLALQGDWDVRTEVGRQGSRVVIDDRIRARDTCLTFLARVAVSDADIAIVPELAIPREAIPGILQTLQSTPRSLVFVGGIEGLTRDEYGGLLAGVGQTQELDPASTGDYVNAMLAVVRTPTTFQVSVRAKRVASRAENSGPPLTLGRGPFTVLKLGTPSITVVPLICAEFVWPEGLWDRLFPEAPGPIDYIPVLQRNHDVDARHTSPQLHRAYTQGGGTRETRFLFVNQARSSQSDGTCYVIVPPTSPADPTFNHALNELWHLPGVQNCKGFRIPDVTGCIWSARITRPGAGASALGTRLCSGTVTEIFAPSATNVNGLAVGLMRSASGIYRDKVLSAVATPVRSAVTECLGSASVRYILRGLTKETANEIFYRMCRAERPLWPSVEKIVGELIEAVALLSAGGDTAILAVCEGDNCSFEGRPVSILYAPSVDAALSARFDPARAFDTSAIPAAIVLVAVVEAPTAVDAHRVGDVLRADRVTSTSNVLVDGLTKTTDVSTTIRVDEVEFHVLSELRPNLGLVSVDAARGRIQQLFPKAYA